MPNALATLSPLSERLRQFSREVRAGNKNVATAAQEIDIAKAALDDDLFISAQSSVSRLKRLNQIRRASGVRELGELPPDLESPGFIANLKRDFKKNMAQALASGLDATSVGLARNIIKGEQPTPPPEGIGFRILSDIISLAADPTTIVSGGLGGIAAKGVAKVAGKKLAGRALARGTAVGTTLGGLTAVREPLGQQVATGEVDIPQAIKATVGAAGLGLAAGGAGALGGAGLRGAAIGTTAEVGTFATGGAALEGRLPNEEDFIHSAGVILGLRTAGKIHRTVGSALFRKARGDQLTPEQQEAVEQLPENVKTRINVEAVGDRSADTTLTKQSLLTPEGAAEFTARHPEVAQTVGSAPEASRGQFKAVENVAPEAEVAAWSRAERDQFKGFVHSALGKEVVVGSRPAEEAAAAAKESTKPAEEVVHPVVEAPKEGKALSKLQDAVVRNAQEAATPDTPPELVPVVPVESVAGARARGLSPARKLYEWVQFGGKPKESRDATNARDRLINRHIRQVQFGIQEYNQAARRTYGRMSKIPDLDLEAINGVLKDRAPLDSIPEKMRGPVKRFRDEVDALSQALIDEGVVQGEMAATVTKNKGTYLHRSYKIFREPNFYKKVPVEHRNKAQALFRQELKDSLGRDPTQDEINAQIDAFLYSSAKAGSPLNLLESSDIKVKNLTFLKEKNEGIPAEIRALWGEDTDPRSVYAQTLIGQGRMLASHRALAEMREQGMGKWLFEKPQGAAIAEIDDGANKALYPLTRGKPVYTFPEYEQALRSNFGRSDNPWLRAYFKLNAGVKWAKTAGSQMGIMRNFFGNPTIAMANGHWRMWNVRRAARAIGTDVAPTVFEFTKLTNRQQKDFVLKMIDMGVMHDASRSGELREIVRDASSADTPDAFMASRIKRGLSLPFSKMSAFFRAGDDFWHVYGYFNELDALKRAYPDKPIASLEGRAAEKVRMTYPTYSLAPALVQKARKAVIIGDFVTFPAEMIRTSINIPRLAAQELAIPAERAIGAQRAFGFSSVATMLTGIGPASRMMTGVSKDKEEAMRVLGPEWMKNSQLLHLGQQDRLKYKAVDLQYSIPQAFMMNPINALLRGEEVVSLQEGPLREAFRPFLNETILFGTVRDVLANQRISSNSTAPIYNKESDGKDQSEDIIKYLVSKLQPGTTRTMEKIYKGITNKPLRGGTIPDTQTEIIAATTGQRIWTYDVPRDLGFKSRTVVDRRREARGIFYEAAYARDGRDEDEIQEAFQKSVDADARLFSEMKEYVGAARLLGMDDKEIGVVLQDKRGGVGDRELERMLGGEHDSENLLRDTVWQLSNKDFDERLPAIVQALGISVSEARRLIIDETRERGYKSISPIRFARIQRRLP